MNKSLIFLILLSVLYSCKSAPEEIYSYHAFKNDTWNRFDNVVFSMEVKKAGTYDVILEVTHNQNFNREEVSFHMIMNTPSGEERINEYSVDAKNKTGKYTGKCEGESCVLNITLKKGIHLTRGTMKLEIENLIPYISTENLKSIGIRIIQRG